MGNSRGRGPRPKALSIRASSASLSLRWPAAAFSAAWSARAAFGMTNNDGRRSRNRSATCRGVALCFAAIFASTWPPGVLGRALAEIIEDLIADHTALAGDFQRFFKVRHIEVADAPG